MTLSEFKAWFEGFTEGIEGAPTEKQFKKIKAKVAEITGTPTTREVFVERYRSYPWWGAIPGYPTHIWNGPYVTYSAGSTDASKGIGSAVLASFSVAGAAPEAERFSAGMNQTVEFDSHAAMRAVGAAEALAY